MTGGARLVDRNIVFSLAYETVQDVAADVETNWIRKRHSHDIGNPYGDEDLKEEGRRKKEEGEEESDGCGCQQHYIQHTAHTAQRMNACSSPLVFSFFDVVLRGRPRHSC